MASLAFDFVLVVETADFGKQGRIGSPARNELGHGRGVGRCNIFAHARRQPAAVVMLAAFLRSWLRREPRHPDTEVRALLRREQSFWKLGARLGEATGRRRD